MTTKYQVIKEYNQSKVLSKKLGKYAYVLPVYFHLVLLNVHIFFYPLMSVQHYLTTLSYL